MALINCSECNREISDKADECPGCGYDMRPAPIQQTPSSNKDMEVNGRGCGLLMIVIGAIVILVVMGAIRSCAYNAGQGFYQTLSGY